MKALISPSGGSLVAAMIIDPRLLYAYIVMFSMQVCDKGSVTPVKSLR